MGLFSTFEIDTGFSAPLGSSVQVLNGKEGVNFALFSQQASAVELCLFSCNGREVRLPMQRSLENIDDSEQAIWHIWVGNISYGTQYGFRVYERYRQHHRITANPLKLMLDPYAKGIVGKPSLNTHEKRAGFTLVDSHDNGMLAPKSLVIDEHFDWGTDHHLRTPWTETILYELHVKGFTKLREDLPEDIRGTYAGLAHPEIIRYLKELGITAVELLPVTYHLDEVHLQEKELSNYWGYNPLGMFAVEPKYWSGKANSTPLSEFKTMVKALHEAGIEVILDMVFNHSAEAGQQSPTFCQRGIDDQYYYWHDEHGRYLNWTGCGNMLNLSKTYTRKWVLDCLRYWADSCHVDGFRFDLATVLGREGPAFNEQALLFNEIAKDPILKGCKFIAEPWDIGEGGYQLGNFPNYFAQWNDRYRDDMRKFWLWKSGELGAFVERFAGSGDLFKWDNRHPFNSINFITAHDGFTLRDLVSYNHKHNEMNGEDNRDGHSENYSYNHGYEGIDITSSAVENSRFSASRALLLSLLLSNGTPMLLAGDEIGNTQYGNNNAYCQDNGVTWLKWANKNDDLLYLVKQIIALRKKITSLKNGDWWNEDNVTWLNIHSEVMHNNHWNDKQVKAMQILLDDEWLFLINAKSLPQTFILPTGEWEIYSSASHGVRKHRNIEVSSLDFCLLCKVG
ncbi:glycogen operon protein [Cricetibacter osteomyelitidis]|uniref:Glycogen operon protein n=1 Tax=Cricetibacter osteomyelitidis TaxID=1521931 RepID=A0A4R2TDY9_9PAST|nr:glycogen debranching protein GlgX [Cricetibacter osteomyelitidis]TCP95378.1 glycogen operon protein [Cricetibacter osteomyelitidis]